MDELTHEAMCAELNARGEEYLYVGKFFPPGVWVEITAAQARTLEMFAGTVTVREKGGE